MIDCHSRLPTRHCLAVVTSLGLQPQRGSLAWQAVWVAACLQIVRMTTTTRSRRHDCVFAPPRVDESLDSKR